MTVNDLKTSEYNPYYQTYIDQVPGDTLIECLKKNQLSTLKLLSGLDESTFDYAYDEGKWSIKALVQHCIDTERIFGIRALRIARNDKTMLPGFDQDEFSTYDEANSRTKSDLIAEYETMRLNSIAMIQSFSNDMLLRIGGASDAALSARAACFIIIGHENHHIRILKERYL